MSHDTYFESYQGDEENEEIKEEEEEKKEEKQEEEPGLWEEDYKTFHDSKPYGKSESFCTV